MKARDSTKDAQALLCEAIKQEYGAAPSPKLRFAVQIALIEAFRLGADPRAPERAASARTTTRPPLSRHSVRPNKAGR
jgi:hypothetical protein